MMRPARWVRIYDDIKAKLVAAGMPPEQIAFIHDARTDMIWEMNFCLASTVCQRYESNVDSVT